VTWWIAVEDGAGAFGFKEGDMGAVDAEAGDHADDATHYRKLHLHLFVLLFYAFLFTS
jgi:hypothetical protein